MTTGPFAPVELFRDIGPGFLFRFTDIKYGGDQSKLKCLDQCGEHHYVDMSSGVVFEGANLLDQPCQTIRKAP